MLYTDVMLEMQHTFLEKVDKSTMLNSVEARVPFLDNELSEFVLALPSDLKVKGGEKKYLLKKALRGIVPDEILDSPKRGFGVPIDTWLRSTLLDQLQSALDDGIRMGYLQADITKRILLEHVEGRANHGYLLWKLMVLFIWLKRYQNKLIYKQL
jgi:asparagine synthase (glutamine-hydrolysing)